MDTKAFMYDTSLGPIGIAEKEGAITHLFFGNTVAPQQYTLEETPTLRQAARQLREYLAGERTSFNLLLQPEGTPFQRRCWEALLTIPYGQTRTYAQQAALIDNPKACRAVGQANSLNPIAIFIPCHRVIGANGKLTGFAGGMDIKEQLLKLENKNENNRASDIRL